MGAPTLSSSLRRLAPWAVVFVLMHAGMTPPTAFPGGAANALSRMATMRAMEHGTFAIDPWVSWMMDPDTPHAVRGEDWAQTPDGHFYSNKAPGSAFVGFPLFAPLDRGEGQPPPWLHRVLAAAFQIAPYLVVVALALTLLPAAAFAGAAFHFTALALLFGNTAALYMGCYFGHALTGWLVLAVAVALLRDRPALGGLAYGFALLSDYSVGLLLPGLLVAFVVRNGRSVRWLVPFALGGVVPGALWVWYHTAAFGGPFAIANHFQNPMFQDTKASGTSLWGIFDLSLRGDVVGELLVGSRRGLLVTQPWMLVAVVAAVALVLRGKHRAIAVFGVVGFGALFVMNACFGAWHGGWCPGPRYMSAIFPALALLAGLAYAEAGRPVRIALWLGLAVAVQLAAQVFATHVLPARDEALWMWQWARITRLDAGWTSLAKLVGFWACVAAATVWVARRERGDALSLEGPTGGSSR